MKAGVSREAKGVRKAMMKNILVWLFGPCSLLLALCFSAQAQQAKIKRVGLLAPPGRVEERVTIKGLRDGLKEARYVEGKNLLLDTPNVKTYEELRPISRGLRGKKSKHHCYSRCHGNGHCEGGNE
jgi:hypothetical protein